MKKYSLTLDLKDDANLINEYEEYHKNIWPEIIASIKYAGILQMEIYRIANRLFMTIETTDEFSFENKTAIDASNSFVQKWEELMWVFQQPLPWAKEGEKWMLMEKIFDLNN